MISTVATATMAMVQHRPAVGIPNSLRINKGMKLTMYRPTAIARSSFFLGVSVTEGDFLVISKEEDPFFAYTRTLGEESFLVVCNFEERTEIQLSLQGKVRLANLERTAVSGIYQPYECAVFQITGSPDGE